MTTNPFHGKVTELGNNLGTNLCVTWCVGRLDIDCHLRVAAVLHDDGDIARCVLTFHMLPQHTASQRAFRFRTLVPRRSVVACLWRILRLQGDAWKKVGELVQQSSERWAQWSTRVAER
jgi:hypothetical protein